MLPPSTHLVEAHVQPLLLARLGLCHLLDRAGVNGAQLLAGRLVLLRCDLRQEVSVAHNAMARYWLRRAPEGPITGQRWLQQRSLIVASSPQHKLAVWPQQEGRQ